MIPYGKQEISQADVNEVIGVLKSEFITQGPKVPEFEAALCNYTGAQYAFAANSATSALHIACLALGLKQGDYLWTSPITFVASANCGLYCGANIDFVDIDARTYNLCPVSLKHKLEKAKIENKLPKVVVPVHFSGQPCDMEAIFELSQEYGFSIIEDASHAIGGSYKEEKIGSCRYSDITIFSFHPVKIITTAEGGVALTNDSKLAEKMSLFRSHGVTRNESIMVNRSHGPWYYEQIELGFNYRMTDIQAALGISQLGRLDQYILKRHELFKLYSQLLSQLPITLPYQLPNTYSGLHLYVIRLNLSKVSVSHKEAFIRLREKGIGVNVHYIPVHLQPYFKDMGFSEGDFPKAETYYKEAISLPMYPGLTTDNLKFIAKSLEEVIVS